MSADTTVLAPDIGALKLAQSDADELGLSSVAVVLKERRGGREVEVSGLVGDDMHGPASLIDDMITTGAPSRPQQLPSPIDGTRRR